ncbi:MAG TPA: universal stress protein [Anaerolineales bacterium]|nr:universal stress protein [Anaerolineales bacterium]
MAHVSHKLNNSLEGAWAYFIFIPLLYATFSYFRNRLGEPTSMQDYLGQLNAAQLAGFGFGQAPVSSAMSENGKKPPLKITWEPEPIAKSKWREQSVAIKRIVLLLDGSPFAAKAIPMGRKISQVTGAQIILLSSVKNHTQALENEFEITRTEREQYLTGVKEELLAEGFSVECYVQPGFIADATASLVDELGINLVITTTRGKSGTMHWLRGGVSRKLVQKLDIPILLVQGDEYPDGALPSIERILVALDGSILSEQVLPYARALAKILDCELVLLSVPAVPEAKNYWAAGDVVEKLRAEAEHKMKKFLSAIARSLEAEGVKVRTLVTGSLPARTIVSVGEEEHVDMIMMTSRGRGGMDLLLSGSVAMKVVGNSPKPVFMVPIIHSEKIEETA